MLREPKISTSKRVLIISVLVVITAVTYLPLLSNGFVEMWDDKWMVIENPYLDGSAPAAISQIFAEPYGGQYSPLNTLTYFVTAKIGGTEPFGFHLVSLILHLANVVLVGLFLEKLLEMLEGIDLDKERQFLLAWGTAGLFGLHPMQVESVAWISASKVPLYSFFYLSGLLVYLVYRRTGKRKYLWFVLVLFLFSLLSKEQAVAFILSMIAVDWVTPGALSKREVWLEKIPFFLAGVSFGILTLWLQQNSFGLFSSTTGYPFYQRLVFAGYGFWEYVIKLIAPYGLSHFYFLPMEIGEPLPPRLWIYPVATGIGLWLMTEYRNQVDGIYLFGGLFFVINIILVLHLIPTSRMTIIADRYIYLSSIGFFLVVAYWFIKWTAKKGNRYKRVAWAAAGIYLLILAGYAHHRIGVWENMETLNRDVKQTVEKHYGDIDYLEQMQYELQQ